MLLAASAFAEHARYLREELAPRARTDDAVGEEAYALHSRSFLGAAVDLRETYAWGLEEVARIEAEMAEVARAVSPGATAPEAIAVLEADPARQVVGTEALREWMQELSDAALTALARGRKRLGALNLRLDLFALSPGARPRHIPDAWRGM